MMNWHATQKEQPHHCYLGELALGVAFDPMSETNTWVVTESCEAAREE